MGIILSLRLLCASLVWLSGLLKAKDVLIGIGEGIGAFQLQLHGVEVVGLHFSDFFPLSNQFCAKLRNFFQNLTENSENFPFLTQELGLFSKTDLQLGL